MSRLPRESPEKRGHFLPSEVSGLWYMEVGRGSRRRRDWREGGGCRNVTQRAGPGRGDFQSGASLSPSLSWASPAACRQARPPPA